MVVTVILIVAVVWATAVVALGLLMLLAFLLGRDEAAAVDRAMTAIAAEFDLEQRSAERLN